MDANIHGHAEVDCAVGVDTAAAITGGARISSMTNVAAGCAIDGAVRHSSCAPSDTNHENGTKNCTEAASHNRWRTCARFPRSASVSSHTTPTTSVDCHRWATTSNDSQSVIDFCLS